MNNFNVKFSPNSGFGTHTHTPARMRAGGGGTCWSENPNSLQSQKKIYFPRSLLPDLGIGMGTVNRRQRGNSRQRILATGMVVNLLGIMRMRIGKKTDFWEKTPTNFPLLTENKSVLFYRLENKDKPQKNIGLWLTSINFCWRSFLCRTWLEEKTLFLREKKTKHGFKQVWIVSLKHDCWILFLLVTKQRQRYQSQVAMPTNEHISKWINFIGYSPCSF